VLGTLLESTRGHLEIVYCSPYAARSTVDFFKIDEGLAATLVAATVGVQTRTLTSSQTRLGGRRCYEQEEEDKLENIAELEKVNDQSAEQPTQRPRATSSLPQSVRGTEDAVRAAAHRLRGGGQNYSFTYRSSASQGPVPPRDEWASKTAHRPHCGDAATYSVNSVRDGGRFDGRGAADYPPHRTAPAPSTTQFVLENGSWKH